MPAGTPAPRRVAWARLLTGAILGLGLACASAPPSDGVAGRAAGPPGGATAGSAGDARDELPPALRAAAVGPEHGSPHPGELAPDFTLPRLDLDGDFTLSSLRGEVILLHFTATWCPFCREEIASLGEIAEQLGPSGVRVVLVDVQETPAHWREAAGPVSPKVITVADEDGRVATSYAPPRAQPFLERAEVVLAGSLIIDREGIIRVFLLADSRGYDPTLADLRGLLARYAGKQAARPAGGGASAGEGSLPAPVVSARAQPVTIGAGGTGIVAVEVTVPEGFHVMSDAPPDPVYVATTLSIDGGDVAVQRLRWPAPEPFRYRGVGEEIELPTFSGRFVVEAEASVPRDAAPGPRTASGLVRYQACTAGRCFMPRQARFDVELVVSRP
jgi:peroxiredoxin